MQETGAWALVKKYIAGDWGWALAEKYIAGDWRWALAKKYIPRDWSWAYRKKSSMRSRKYCKKGKILAPRRFIFPYTQFVGVTDKIFD